MDPTERRRIKLTVNAEKAVNAWALYRPLRIQWTPSNPNMLFRPPELERQYQRWRFSRLRGHFRRVGIVALLMYMLFGLFDILNFPEAILPLFIVRFLIICPLGLAYVIVTCTRAFRSQRDKYFTVGVLWVYAIGGLVSRLIVGATTIAYSYMIVLWSTHTIMPVGFFFATIHSVGMVLIYLIFFAIFTIPTMKNVTNDTLPQIGLKQSSPLFGSIVAGMLTSYFIESGSRNNYLAKCKAEHALRQLRSSYLVARRALHSILPANIVPTISGEFFGRAKNYIGTWDQSEMIANQSEPSLPVLVGTMLFAPFAPHLAANTSIIGVDMKRQHEWEAEQRRFEDQQQQDIEAGKVEETELKTITQSKEEHPVADSPSPLLAPGSRRQSILNRVSKKKKKAQALSARERETRLSLIVSPQAWPSDRTVVLIVIASNSPARAIASSSSARAAYAKLEGVSWIGPLFRGWMRAGDGNEAEVACTWMAWRLIQSLAKSDNSARAAVITSHSTIGLFATAAYGPTFDAFDALDAHHGPWLEVFSAASIATEGQVLLDQSVHKALDGSAYEGKPHSDGLFALTTPPNPPESTETPPQDPEPEPEPAQAATQDPEPTTQQTQQVPSKWTTARAGMLGTIFTASVKDLARATILEDEVEDTLHGPMVPGDASGAVVVEESDDEEAEIPAEGGMDQGLVHAMDGKDADLAEIEEEHAMQNVLGQKLRRFFLTFSEWDLEERFRTYYARTNHFKMRIVALTLTANFISGAYNDWVMVDDWEPWWGLFFVRCYQVTGCVLFFLATWTPFGSPRFPRWDHNMQRLSIAFALAMAAGSVVLNAMVAAIKWPNSTEGDAEARQLHDLYGAVVIKMAMFFTASMRLRYVNSTMVTLAFLIGYLIAFSIFYYNPDDVIARLSGDALWLVTTLLLGMLASSMLEKRFRMTFRLMVVGTFLEERVMMHNALAQWWGPSNPFAPKRLGVEEGEEPEKQALVGPEGGVVIVRLKLIPRKDAPKVVSLSSPKHSSQLTPNEWVRSMTRAFATVDVVCARHRLEGKFDVRRWDSVGGDVVVVITAISGVEEGATASKVSRVGSDISRSLRRVEKAFSSEASVGRPHLSGVIVGCTGSLNVLVVDKGRPRCRILSGNAAERCIPLLAHFGSSSSVFSSSPEGRGFPVYLDGITAAQLPSGSPLSAQKPMQEGDPWLLLGSGSIATGQFDETDEDSPKSGLREVMMPVMEVIGEEEEDAMVAIRDPNSVAEKSEVVIDDVHVEEKVEPVKAEEDVQVGEVGEG